MVDVIYNMPNFLIFALISTTLVIFSIIGILIVHWICPYDYLSRDNGPIGNIIQNIGIIYAILVGFIALFELGIFDKSDQAEQKEATTMISIYREAGMLPDPIASTIREQIKKYGNHVIHNEWPAMKRGAKINNEGISILNTLYKEVHAYKIENTLGHMQLTALHNITTATNLLYDQHELRVASTDSSLSADVWFVLILGTILIIVINCVFGMEMRLHLFAIMCVAIMVSSVVYLIVILDRPYRGDFAIKPLTFSASLAFINSN